MEITRRNNINGELSTMDVPISKEQYDLYLSGIHVQVAAPEIKPCEREFLINGVTPQQWEDIFGGCTQECVPCKYNVKQLKEE